MTDSYEPEGNAPRNNSALRIREMPAAERPRERLTRLGASALSAVELLALVIGSGGGGRSALGAKRRRT